MPDVFLVRTTITKALTASLYSFTHFHSLIPLSQQNSGTRMPNPWKCKHHYFGKDCLRRRLVLVTLDAVRKNSAVPDEANLASTMALVHPLSSSRVPSDFSAAISIWSPPDIMTNLFSPYSGHSHWICFSRAYSGWSAAMTGV